MKIVVNGSEREVADGSTIAEFVASIGWRSEWVVVERNGEAVPRADLARIRLERSDRIEVVRAVAGG